MVQKFLSHLKHKHMKLPDQHNCKIAVLGLGYVGLPLAVEIATVKKCYRSKTLLNRSVIGYEINLARLSQLKSGIDITKEINKNKLSSFKNIQFTNNASLLKEAEIFIVTVPTPIDKNNNPNFTFIKQATTTVGRAIKERNDLLSKNNDAIYSSPIVIYESTVYPGATEEICAKILREESGLEFNNEETGKGFFCGYSPERINPGDNNHKLTNIVKVTSGSSNEVANWVDDFYGSIIKAGTYKVKSIKVAEAAKVIENTQRDINISLMNELAMIFKKLDIDTLDVIDAASTKWNFMPFKPGLVGGHCIGVDPYYLTYKAEQIGYHSQVVTSGRRINDGISNWIVDNFIKLLLKSGIVLKNAKILILGLSFKENCPDIRNTKVIEVIKEIENYGFSYEVVDPWADAEEAKEFYSINIKKEINFDNSYQGVICAVAHKEFQNISIDQWRSLIVKNGVIFDVKGFLPRELKAERL